MKKQFLLLLPSLLLSWGEMKADGVITIETAKAVGEELSVTTYCTSINEPVIIDWGDGVEKSILTVGAMSRNRLRLSRGRQSKSKEISSAFVVMSSSLLHFRQKA